jgi:hypothetical protein
MVHQQCQRLGESQHPIKETELEKTPKGMHQILFGVVCMVQPEKGAEWMRYFIDHNNASIQQRLSTPNTNSLQIPAHRWPLLIEGRFYFDFWI